MLFLELRYKVMRWMVRRLASSRLGRAALRRELAPVLDREMAAYLREQANETPAAR